MRVRKVDDRSSSRRCWDGGPTSSHRLCAPSRRGPRVVSHYQSSEKKKRRAAAGAGILAALFETSVLDRERERFDPRVLPAYDLNETCVVYQTGSSGSNCSDMPVSEPTKCERTDEKSLARAGRTLNSRAYSRGCESSHPGRVSPGWTRRAGPVPALRTTHRASCHLIWRCKLAAAAASAMPPPSLDGGSG